MRHAKTVIPVRRKPAASVRSCFLRASLMIWREKRGRINETLIHISIMIIVKP